MYVYTYIHKYRWVCLYVYIHYTHRHKPESESDSKIAAGSGGWQLAGLTKTKCLDKWPATSGYINSQHCRRRHSARLATNASIHRHTYKQTYYVYICVYACLLYVCTICLCQLSSIFFSFFLSRFCNVSTTQHKQRGGEEERRRRNWPQLLQHLPQQLCDSRVSCIFGTLANGSQQLAVLVRFTRLKTRVRRWRFDKLS